MNPSARTVAVVSHVWAGHIEAYHALLVARLRAQGCQVLSLSPQLPRGVRSEEGVHWRTWRRVGPPRRSLAARAARRYLQWTGSWQAAASRELWRETAAAIGEAERELGIEVSGTLLVFLGDTYLEHGVGGRHVDRDFGRPWAGILNGPGPVRAHRPRPTFYAWMMDKEAALRARSCRGVVLTSEYFRPACAAAWPGVPLHVMPEVADLTPPRADDPVAPKVSEFAAGRRVVGLLGNIAPRKGIPAFLAAARLAVTAAPELCFVLAGEFSPASCPPAAFRRYTALFADRPDNCLISTERIAEGADFNGMVAACDVIYAAYDNFPFNSNLLSKAAHFRRPVVVSPGFVMAELTRRYRLGEVTDPADIGELVAVLRQLARGLDRSGADLRTDHEGMGAINAASRLDPVLVELLAAWSASSPACVTR